MGLGFAIPSNLASVVKDSIISTGKFEKPYIGVYLNNLDSDKIKVLNIKSTNGVLIAKVIPNGPASRAGIQANDVVVAVNGKPVNSAGAFIGELAAKKIGETVELSIIRKRTIFGFLSVMSSVSSPAKAGRGWGSKSSLTKRMLPVMRRSRSRRQISRLTASLPSRARY